MLLFSSGLLTSALQLELEKKNQILQRKEHKFLRCFHLVIIIKFGAWYRLRFKSFKIKYVHFHFLHFSFLSPTSPFSAATSSCPARLSRSVSMLWLAELFLQLLHSTAFPSHHTRLRADNLRRTLSASCQRLISEYIVFFSAVHQNRKW